MAASRHIFLEKRIGVPEKNGSEVASPKMPKPEGPRAGEVLGEGQQAPSHQQRAGYVGCKLLQRDQCQWRLSPLVAVAQFPTRIRITHAFLPPLPSVMPSLPFPFPLLFFSLPLPFPLSRSTVAEP